VSDEAVRLAVIGKLGWIRRQRARFEDQPRQSKREMVSGESHYFQGQRYRLNVVVQDGPARIPIRNEWGGIRRCRAKARRYWLKMRNVAQDPRSGPFALLRAGSAAFPLPSRKRIAKTATLNDERCATFHKRASAEAGIKPPPFYLLPATNFCLLYM
jgi:hypothetical protein